MDSSDDGFRCCVGGISPTTDAETLKKAFSAYGHVIDAEIVHHHVTGKPRGFAYVTFADEKCMKDAVKGMYNQYVDGRTIAVNETFPKELYGKKIVGFCGGIGVCGGGGEGSGTDGDDVDVLH